MATQAQVSPSAAAGELIQAGARRLAWLKPSFTDFFFAALILWLFCTGLGWKSLMFDGDTGWHIRTGDYILQNGLVPKTDIFSYAQPGKPWFAWEWLTDVIYSVLHSGFGLAGPAVLSGLMICAVATSLLRRMVIGGANAFIAIGLTLLTIGSSSVHFHARPHIFTLLLFAIFTWTVERDRLRNTRAVWLLIPLTALWTNLHGAFPAAIAYAGLVSAGIFIQNLLERKRDFKQPLRYGLLATGCGLASLVNPYGWHLHAHIFEYLRADFIRNMVQEFESPRFRSEEMFQYELLLLGALMCAGLALARRRIPETLLLLFFAHMSLGSVRHVPLFVIVAAPAIAVELTRLWNATLGQMSSKSNGGILHQLAIDMSGNFRRPSVWLPALAALIILSTPADKFPVDFPSESFPSKMLEAQHDRISRSERIFTTDQWGDYLIYRLFPNRKVFFDGRSDFYGEQHCKDVLAITDMGHRWLGLIEKNRFDLILIPVKAPLSSGLKLSPDWTVVADDGSAVLFERKLRRKS